MKKILFATLMLLLAVTFNSCGPYKQPKWKDIGANETGFLIPMEQGNATNQQMLQSVDYLKKNIISAKRVYIEQKKISTGRMWWHFKYIPTDTLIVVHRAPVTREWTEIPNQKTDSKNAGLNVESSESIGFTIPVNCTGSVLEEDAARFLYNYGGQTIEYVMDHNVRPYILDYFTTEFGRRGLGACQRERNLIYDSMKVKTIAFFKNYGLTIINLGVAGEFTFTDPAISTAINSKFISEMKITAAQNEAEAAQKFAVAAESIRKQKELDADVQFKLDIGEGLKTGKLVLPSTLVIGKDGNLMDLFALKNLSSSKQ